jgi:prepilin-type N-terminal cleavage/methylation domain-containing protein
MSQKQLTNFLSRGSTLIEVLVAILIMAIVLTGLSAALTYSLKNSAQADYRQVATRHAQDVIEILRKERSELGWTAFESSFNGGNTYCVGTNQISFDDPTVSKEFSTGTCTGNVTVAQSPVTFTRSFRRIGNTTDVSLVSVEVTVTWNDGAATRDVRLVQEFRDIN